MAVQYSIQKMVSDGTLSTIALGIQYLQRNDIYIRIAGKETPQSGAPSGYTWSFVDNTTLKILPVIPNGVEVVVCRRTDVDTMYNIYSQNAQFDEATIDENNQQLLYIAQEYLEQGLPGAGVDTIEYLRDDGSYTYYRVKRTDGSYSDEFAVPSASSATKVLAREALRRSYAEAGFTLVAGSFEAGGTLVNVNDVLLQERTGKAFSGPVGTVAEGTNPASGGFVDSSPNLLSDGITDFADSTYADMVLAITTPITDRINVATWNIWSWRTIPNYYNHDWATTEKISATVDVALSEGVHILGIQETLIPLGYEDDFLSRGFYRGINIRNRTDRLGYDGNPKTPLAYGNAILSSIPILETGGGNFAVQDMQEQGWALAVVDIGGDEVAFYCCHTTSHTSEALLAQVQEMADIAAADTRSKVVVVGDFNTGDSGCQALVDSGLTMLNADGQYNTNNIGGTWYIDRIFYRGFSAHGNLRALSQPEKLGDHKPFFATLYI